MAILRFGKDWSRKQLLTSILLFFVHFVILVSIMAGALLGKELKNLQAHMGQFGASYLYALFCILLLIVIMYLYFLFDGNLFRNKKVNKACFILIAIGFGINWIYNLLKFH